MATITGDSSHVLKARQEAGGGYGGAETAEVNTSVRISSGTGENQADLMHHSEPDENSIGGSANLDVDLTALLDGAGSAISGLSEVCYFRISAPSTNGGELEIKPSVANGWASLLKDPSDVMIVEPGASVTLECWAAAAYAVDGTHKSINILNTDGSGGAYGITLLGRSA